ncbi:hypothetical protein CMUS01_01102 [Colletotrichum musicola]|uniref:Uncharacterized protein n=1 Tax=Colletotrichum musicola TaxID=2175873 RepID=A0A8H6U907_9PEZI|nr:hypothetical protein CMUS01_01102 [Colletotrichum musicola]
MCFYRSTQYKCKHVDIRQKVANCQEQDAFLAGKRQRYCFKRETHSIQCVKVDIDCWKCVQLDDLQNRAKSTLRQLKLANKLEAFSKAQTDASASSKSPGSSGSSELPGSPKSPASSKSPELRGSPESSGPPESPSVPEPISLEEASSDIETLKIDASGAMLFKEGTTGVSDL